MKETRVPPAHAMNLVANYGNALWGFKLLDPGDQITVKFETKYNNFHTRKWIWKSRPHNDGLFVSVSLG